MLVITDAEARRFTDSLAEREYSPATISKYAHDLRCSWTTPRRA